MFFPFLLIITKLRKNEVLKKQITKKNSGKRYCLNIFKSFVINLLKWCWCLKLKRAENLFIYNDYQNLSKL
ncbi:hypothetical protein D9V87_05130 [Bacteroidetes/Chlorobi group bacterium MS-B_bin-24]|nr:MAG: hypothetical protein D9V87_06550 [Bacteroidetes/Chlorobi group bacterium MS-B_bin-24]ROL59521.1 MAG: hypothetical protein D9V87_05130 [Bacteroidetes/Chlorobi group bacterium MS-B_bin-24]